VRLNLAKGLAIDALWFKAVAEEPLCGTLPHGYYDDIHLGADYYTGHLVLEMPGRPKITDLEQVQPAVANPEGGGWTEATAAIPTHLGEIRKTVRVSWGEPRVELLYSLGWRRMPVGSLRLGYVTLNPEAFDRQGLRYRTHNGGRDIETFPLADTRVDHGGAVSFLVSAAQCLGATGGLVELGNAGRTLRVEVDRSAGALAPMVTYREVADRYFCRLAWSAGEVDETRRPSVRATRRDACSYRVAVSAPA
jgi:hypothetical protein